MPSTALEHHLAMQALEDRFKVAAGRQGRGRGYHEGSTVGHHVMLSHCYGKFPLLTLSAHPGTVIGHDALPDGHHYCGYEHEYVRAAANSGNPWGTSWCAWMRTLLGELPDDDLRFIPSGFVDFRRSELLPGENRRPNLSLPFLGEIIRRLEPKVIWIAGVGAAEQVRHFLRQQGDQLPIASIHLLRRGFPLPGEHKDKEACQKTIAPHVRDIRQAIDRLKQDRKAQNLPCPNCP